MSIPTDAKKDNLIPNLYSINKKSENIKNLFELNSSGDIIFQSKSSCLPVHFLSTLVTSEKLKTKKNFDIIDSCSAPGNKTFQLSSCEQFKNSKIFAFESDEKRYATLEKRKIKLNQNNNIHTTLIDFLEVDTSDKLYENVKMIVVDPSCSASGTFNNRLIENLADVCCLNTAGSELEMNQMERLKKLAMFQIKIIKKAMSFPKYFYVINC